MRTLLLWPSRFSVRQLLDSGWYPQLNGKFRLEQIEQDVERYWHLKIAEAKERLKDQGSSE
jgi:hypothetical protein